MLVFRNQPHTHPLAPGIPHLGELGTGAYAGALQPSRTRGPLAEMHWWVVPQSGSFPRTTAAFALVGSPAALGREGAQAFQQ